MGQFYHLIPTRIAMLAVWYNFPRLKHRRRMSTDTVPEYPR